ncbi:phosphodiester glycosidase family protein [Sphingomonas sp. UYAg733]
MFAKQGACDSTIFDDVPFTICTANPAEHSIQLAELDAQDKPMRSFRRLEAVWRSRLNPMAFAMNAGMYDDAGLPVGLYVEHNKELRPLNRRRGTGNFHMMPNGVFYGDDSGWHVATTAAFAARAPASLHFATQSGPMLVNKGAFNPALAENGESRFIRNAVGINHDGKAFFAISDAPVSFGKFARLFRDRLDCPNALYLDGAVSSLWDIASGRRDDGVPIGPIVVVLQTR